MSRTSHNNVQTLFMSATVLALAVTARPISDLGVLTEMGQQAFSHAQQAAFAGLPHFIAQASAEVAAPSERVRGALEHLIDIAGQAPLLLVERWAHGAPVDALPAVVHHSSSAATGDATIFVFAAPSPGDPALESYPPAGVALVAESEDGDVVVAAPQEDVADPALPELPTEPVEGAALLPLMATCIVAVLALGVVASLVAIYRVLCVGVEKLVPATDEEAKGGDSDSDTDGDRTPTPSKRQKSAVDAESAQMDELVEKVLLIMDTAPRAAKPPPHLIALPAPTADEDVDADADAECPLTPRAAPAVLSDLPLHAAPLALHAWHPAPAPAIPLQVALLFPWLDDGWLVRFLIVLCGLWSFGRTQQ